MKPSCRVAISTRCSVLLTFTKKCPMPGEGGRGARASLQLGFEAGRRPRLVIGRLIAGLAGAAAAAGMVAQPWPSRVAFADSAGAIAARTEFHANISFLDRLEGVGQLHYLAGGGFWIGMGTVSGDFHVSKVGSLWGQMERLAAAATSTSGRQPNPMQKLMARLRMLDKQNDRGADHDANDEILHFVACLILMPSRRAFCRITPGVRRSLLARASKSCTFASAMSSRSDFIDQFVSAARFFAIGSPRANDRAARGPRQGETANDLYAFLTTEPNAEVGAIHPKAMRVVLTTPEEVEASMIAPPDEVLKLQRPLPDGSLRIVARGVKGDPAGSVT